MQRRDLCELTNVCDPDRKRDESPLRRGLDFLQINIFRARVDNLQQIIIKSEKVKRGERCSRRRVICPARIDVDKK